MQAALEEPLVVLDAVAGEVSLHFRYIAVETEAGHGRVALGDGLVQPAGAVLLEEGAGEVLYVVAVIAVLRELHGVLAEDELGIARLDGGGELLDLVARVVDIELAPDLGPGAGEHLGQRVAEDAAAGVAHVHGAGGVGGDELHHYLLAAHGVGAAVVRALGGDGGHDLAVPGGGEAEVYEAGARGLGGGEIAAGEVEVRDERVGYLPRRHVQCLCAGHGMVCGKVAVIRVLGHLYGAGERRAGGQFALFRRTLKALREESVYLIFRLFNKICHLPHRPVL